MISKPFYSGQLPQAQPSEAESLKYSLRRLKLYVNFIVLSNFGAYSTVVRGAIPARSIFLWVLHTRLRPDRFWSDAEFFLSLEDISGRQVGFFPCVRLCRQACQWDDLRKKLQLPQENTDRQYLHKKFLRYRVKN